MKAWCNIGQQNFPNKEANMPQSIELTKLTHHNFQIPYLFLHLSCLIACFSPTHFTGCYFHIKTRSPVQPNHACNMAVLDKAPTSRSLYYTLRKSMCVFYKVSALLRTLSIINTSFREILTLRSLTSLTICRANECNQTLKLQGDQRTAKV